MTNRWTKEGATPGEDPREIDEELHDERALDRIAAQEGLTHPQPRRHMTGISSDAPGTDVDEAPPAPGEARHLDPEEPEPDRRFGLDGHPDE